MRYNFYTATLAQDIFDPDDDLSEEALITDMCGAGSRLLEDHMVLQTEFSDLQGLKNEIKYWLGADPEHLDKAELELCTGYWFMCFEAPRIQYNGTWQVTFCKLEESDMEEVAA